jgi:hypothetical protein
MPLDPAAETSGSANVISALEPEASPNPASYSIADKVRTETLRGRSTSMSATGKDGFGAPSLRSIIERTQAENANEESLPVSANLVMLLEKMKRTIQQRDTKEEEERVRQTQLRKERERSFGGSDSSSSLTDSAGSPQESLLRTTLPAGHESSLSSSSAPRASPRSASARLAGSSNEVPYSISLFPSSPVTNSFAGLPSGFPLRPGISTDDELTPRNGPVGDGGASNIVGPGTISPLFLSRAGDSEHGSGRSSMIGHLPSAEPDLTGYLLAIPGQTSVNSTQTAASLAIAAGTGTTRSASPRTEFDSFFDFTMPNQSAAPPLMIGAQFGVGASLNADTIPSNVQTNGGFLSGSSLERGATSESGALVGHSIHDAGKESRMEVD